MTVDGSCAPIAALVRDMQPKAALQLTGSGDVDAVERSEALSSNTFWQASCCDCVCRAKQRLHRCCFRISTFMIKYALDAACCQFQF